MYPACLGIRTDFSTIHTSRRRLDERGDCGRPSATVLGSAPRPPSAAAKSVGLVSPPPGLEGTDHSDLSSESSVKSVATEISSMPRSRGSSVASSPCHQSITVSATVPSSKLPLFVAPSMQGAFKPDVQSSASSSQASPRGPLHEESLAKTMNGQSEDDTDREIQRNKDLLLRHMTLASTSGRLTMMNLSRRGLKPNDAVAIREAIINNPHLAVLKLSYNELGDKGTVIVATGLTNNGIRHKNLSLLDLGFNEIGDIGCAGLALHAVAGNYTLKTLYLSGNHIKQQGVMAIAGALLHGCGLAAIHLSVNSLGPVGVQALARAVAEREASKRAVVQNPDGSLGPDPHSKSADIQTIEELHLGGTGMRSDGFSTIPSMLLTNFSMQVLSLSNNNLDDNDMSLLAQSFSRNKNIPLRVLNLSHNSMSCVGVELIMNAVWGSKSLREMRFDNNRIRDRGAQLFAVVLTSINLEVIDLSFNKVTTDGIKALMKSLSENNSLRQLGLCGTPIDQNSAKALSYGIAYNSSLQYLYVDNCSIGYSAQRHIVAGVVSNRKAALRVLTGFPVGAIVVTLGLPKPLEGWTNDQVLGFVRKMWKLCREENGTKLTREAATGPAPPAAVVAASKRALAVIGVDGAAHLKTEPYERAISDSSPLVNTNATLLERTMSGTLRVPPIVQGLKGAGRGSSSCLSEAWTEAGMNPIPAKRPAQIGPRCDPARKERNLLWLRKHFRSLHEIGRLPFNNADLWQLHQFFFSPLSATTPSTEQDASIEGRSPIQQGSQVSADVTQSSPHAKSPKKSGHHSPRNHPSGDSHALALGMSPSTHKRSQASQSSPLPPDAPERASLGRAISSQMLNEVAATATSASLHRSQRRRALEVFSGDDSDDDDDEDDSDDDSYSSSSSEEVEPSSKRPRNFKPRIAFYPRIRQKLEEYGTKPSQHETLALLRQLKFAENAIFQGKDVYTDPDLIRNPEKPTPSDIEMIILDLL